MAEISRREDARVCAPSGHDCAFSRAGSSCMDNIRLFADLPASAKRELLSCSRHSTHPAGSIIVHEGDPIESIVVVRSGRIKTFRTSLDGKEYVLDVLHDGQALWHGMFLADHTYRYSVACLTRVELCRIHRADFEALLANHPDVALGLIRMICTEAGDIDDVDQPLGPAHRVLLGSHIYIIENICNVAEIGSVRCQLIAVPLCIREGTGSPLRLLAVTD